MLAVEIFEQRNGILTRNSSEIFKACDIYQALRFVTSRVGQQLPFNSSKTPLCTNISLCTRTSVRSSISSCRIFRPARRIGAVTPARVIASSMEGDSIPESMNACSSSLAIADRRPTDRPDDLKLEQYLFQKRLDPRTRAFRQLH